MRILYALPLLGLAAACNVNNDAANDTVTLEYNQQQIENAARDARDATRNVATSVGNIATSTGRAIGNEVGDIDVDITRNRNDSGNSH